MTLNKLRLPWYYYLLETTALFVQVCCFQGTAAYTSAVGKSSLAVSLRLFSAI